MKYSYLIILFLIICCTQKQSQTVEANLQPAGGQSIAVLAEGCFWCAEHVFEAIPGVDSVVSGYAGGRVLNPTYEQVGAENTGHAEAILIYYDSTKINFNELLCVFFASQDPTTPNQQGPDKGESYRSIAFYNTEAEKKIIEQKISKLDSAKAFASKIVTEIKKLEHFYIAENRHQNYVKRNPTDSYVMAVSIPRFNNFKKKYFGKLKQAE
jgi:peptide-methionine (S)-S-oxide reductase